MYSGAPWNSGGSTKPGQPTLTVWSALQWLGEPSPVPLPPTLHTFLLCSILAYSSLSATHIGQSGTGERER